jgi:hypothetical protein
MSMLKPTTPELAAAVQLLYACADRATTYLSRQMLFRAIHHLTGKPLMGIVRTWEATHAS